MKKQTDNFKPIALFILVPASSEAFKSASEKTLKPMADDPHAARRQAWVDMLKRDFTRAEAVTLAEQIGIATRTADRWLAKLVGAKLLKRLRHGHYSMTA